MTLSCNRFALLLPTIIVFFVCSFFSHNCIARENLPLISVIDKENYQFRNDLILDLQDGKTRGKLKLLAKLPKKVTAVLLTVALGPFGVHRLYLGTEAKVPVIYTLTLGGGLGILPLLDIIAILSSPSLDVYVNNPKVVMWAK